MTNVTPFKNQHLSYSRLSRFKTCPLSYRLHYIEKKQAADIEAMRKATETTARNTGAANRFRAR